MDAEIEDIKRRAGMLTEQDDTSASDYLQELDNVITAEIEWIERLSRVIVRAVPPVNQREVLGVLGNRRQQLQKYHRDKVSGPQQKAKQQQQQDRFKKAEIEKSGGPRRPA